VVIFSSSTATVVPVAAPTVVTPSVIVSTPIVVPVIPTVTAPVISDPITPTVTAPVVDTYLGTTPVVVSTLVVETPTGKPACFGQCDVMSEKCLMCVHTIDCDAITKK